jgi:SAM-dependent methyltransferase
VSAESFTADWLTLREPYDAMAVDHGLLEVLARWADTRPGGLRVVDLGAGTGANLRRLAPLLGSGQRWTLVELDPALVAAAGEASPAAASVDAGYRRFDLARDLERVADDGPVDLLAASALLDLVSEGWLRRLATLCQHLGCALYASLTYDGRVAWTPEDPRDRAAHHAVDRHQRTDKGFGPALGPDAPPALARLLATADGTLCTAASDWRLGPDDAEIQRELLRGYAEAAEAIAPDRAEAFRAWRHRRQEHLLAGRSELTVGHQDLLFVPA